MPELTSSALHRAAQLNTQTRGLDTYESHRCRTMQLISIAAGDDSSGRDRSLTVLGAGNCLDLNLDQLTYSFHQINLLDLDAEALTHALLGLRRTQRERVQDIAPFDIAAPLCSTLPDEIGTPEQGESVCRTLEHQLKSVPISEADVVASTCVLSQIIGTLIGLATEQHAQFLPLLQAVRRGHIRRMLQLTKPGGRCIFITDLVSSDSVPQLLQVSDADLPGLLSQCLMTGNFFSGLNPAVLLQDFQITPEICSLCFDVQIQAPWKWQMGKRVYAVYAIQFRRV